MADPNWNNGSYYAGLPPHTGMKLARRKSLLAISVMPVNHTSILHLDDRNSYHHISFWP